MVGESYFPDQGDGGEYYIGDVTPHREAHEGAHDEVRLSKLLERMNLASDNAAAAGTVLSADNSAPPVVAFREDVDLAGYFHAGDADPPANTDPGDGTYGRLMVGTDEALDATIQALVVGAVAISKFGRVGAKVGLTGATTDGDWAQIRSFIEDANFLLSIVSSNPRVTLASGDYLQYNRASDYLSLFTATVEVFRAAALSLRHSGYASFIGVLTDPANTTPGDVSALRVHVGPDGAFSSGKELEVVGDALVSSSLQVGGNVGFFATSPTTQKTGGQNVTNNVTNSGSTDGTIPDITDGVTYANDYTNLRRALYQLARMQKQDHDALRAYGLLT